MANNPSAFPVSDIFDSNGCGIREGSPGMTLRDYFASKAMGAYVSRGPPLSQVSESDIWRRAVVQSAYEFADAMLAAREQGS